MIVLGVFLGLLLLFLAWRKHKYGKEKTLGGLESERPVFSVEPPARRIGRLKDGAL